jgi:hypothetical protein
MAPGTRPTLRQSEPLISFTDAGWRKVPKGEIGFGPVNGLAAETPRREPRAGVVNECTGKKCAILTVDAM